MPVIGISEHLPKPARSADKHAILRGVSHTLAAHLLDAEHLMTGNRPLPQLKFSPYDAVISKELGEPRETHRVLWGFPRQPQSRLVVIVQHGKLIPELVQHPKPQTFSPALGQEIFA